MSSQVTRRARRAQGSPLAHPSPRKQAAVPAPSRDTPAGQVCGRFRLEELRVLQCGQCYTVLGDSLSVCGEAPGLACLICLRVTNDVLIEKCLMLDVEGALAGSSYNPLSCRSCRMFLGFCLYSTYKNLAHLRGLFCLSKDKVCCYLLESKQTVPASELKFSHASLKSQFAELKLQLVEAYVGVRFLTSQLKELTTEEAQKGQSDLEQGKMALDKMETKNSPEGPET